MVRAAAAAVIAAIAILRCAAVVSADDLAQLKAVYKRPEAIPFPASNPYTPEKAALGKALFFDPRLSGAGNMNCASCHNPSFGWEVPEKTAIGAMNARLPRKGPTILDVAWRGPFFWDGRAATVEEQANGPIEAPAEMNLPLPEAVKRLEGIPAYKAWFAKVFPGEEITADSIVKAIATYERTVVSGYAPFDAWVDGDENAITDSAKRGFALFTGRANCSQCHTGWNFTGNKFHDMGTSSTDPGRATVEPDNPLAMHAFKTPTLRDVAQRAPYMHNGVYDSLEEVLRHYQSGAASRPSISPLFKPVDLTPEESRDIIEFLGSLTGATQAVSLPILPH